MHLSLEHRLVGDATVVICRGRLTAGAESAALIAITAPACGNENPRSTTRNDGSQKLSPMTTAKRTNCSQLHTHSIG